MEHAFLDKYCDLDSIIHRLDPRTKIVSLFLYVIFVVLTKPYDFFQFIMYLMIIFIIIFISKVPLNYIIKKSLLVFPFVLLTIIFIPFYKKGSPGLIIIWNVLIKSWLCVLAMITLSSTTKFSNFLNGLKLLKVPKILVILLSFMYRYIFVLLDETMRIEQARNSRYFGGKLLKQIRVFGNIIGILFIRTYERTERIFQSMLSRGFNGDIYTINPLKFSKNDFLFLTLFLTILSFIKIFKFL
jgi:cobalt/nickel transport system permease protein